MQPTQAYKIHPAKHLFVILSLIVFSSACAPVHFHQKGRLSDPIMRFDVDPLAAELHGHMITPREGAIGGFNAVNAGGCSCK